MKQGSGNFKPMKNILFGSLAIFGLMPALCQASTVSPIPTVSPISDTALAAGFPGTFNYIGYNSSNAAFGQPVASDFLAFGGRFYVSGVAASVFTPNTTVTATQGGPPVNVPYFNAPSSDPNLFYRTIAYDPLKLGAWALTVSNPTYGTTVFNTSAIPASLASIAPPSFITGISLNNTSTSPTVSWNQPAYTAPSGYNQSTRIFVFDLNGGKKQEIYRADVPSSQTSFTIPSTVNLQPNGHYGFIIRDDYRTPSNDTNGVSSQSYFDFHTNSNAPFTGQIYVPVSSVNAVGNTVYSFNLAVTHGQSYNLDPAVALGYIFSVGNSGPNFATVKLPNLGMSHAYELLTWDGLKFVFAANLAANTLYDFGANGVSKFEVLGIDSSLGLDPTNSTAFVTQLTFTGDGTFTGSMTAVTDVPEPSTWAMLVLGFAAVGFLGYRRKFKPTFVTA